MAWKAKTFAKTLMTVALEITFGLLSAMTDRFGYAKANIVIRSSLPGCSIDCMRDAEPQSENDQFRTPPHTFAGSIALSGLSFLALSSKTSVVSG